MTPSTSRLLATAAATVGLCALVLSSIAAIPSASAASLDEGQWWRAAMGVDELHRSGTGKGITVAVIDGPIDSSVPELRGKVVSSTTECVARDGSVHDSDKGSTDSSHATSMAALIAGSGRGTAPGGRGIAGIAPDARIRHYAIMFESSYRPGKSGCGLEYEDVDVGGKATARALQQAVKDGAKVISMSVSVDFDEALIPALLDAYRAGAIVVASTNNEKRQVFWPGLGNGVVTVTHVDAKGNLDTSAVRKSSEVDFAAPGSKVTTGLWTPGGWRSDIIMDGSSQATAITAGGLAAMWSAHPTATGNQVLQAAKDSIGMREKDGKYLTWFRRIGTNLPKATGKTESYGFGIFDPADAVKLDVSSLPDVNPMVDTEGDGDPTAEQIATATGKAVTESASPAPSTSGSSVDASPNPAGEAADDTDEAGGSESSLLPWLAVGAVVVLALVAGLFFLRRRHGVTRPQRPHHTSEPTTAADHSAVTTKEASHGHAP
ncbi:hypothetical protein N802_01325 [Knoellia sinensis KCTC 19936]|uniref:Peptidase S8/S53 domain-containing protein n=1 Tax=Knoellia sinensis KCTC 19936 TaxID=1385520 RepID=A0A0A0JG41_9MICO|nr:S8/S53 family peptidase [Knoellia sinensis]KGN35017.1 hypothetical protein N802_01325 [Knoellia sinensis KCTC 19936]